MAQNLLSDTQLKAIRAVDKRQNISAGHALFVVIESLTKGGGKSFVGRTRFPPGRDGKQVEVRIGVYGRGPGQWSLKEARDEWQRIRVWSHEQRRDPRDLKREQKAALVPKLEGPTLVEVAEAYLAHSTNRESTKVDYRNMLFNQVLPILGPDTPVKSLTWDSVQRDGRNGRQVVLDLKQSIVDRGSAYQSDKCLLVMRLLFAYAIEQGWMDRNQNPALGSRGVRSKHKSKPHPTLRWEQLPEFFDRLEHNEPKAIPVTICAVKMAFMTFLRVGSLVPMRWSELDEEQDLWVIPADRMKSGREHAVPLTEEIKTNLLTLKKYTGNQEFVFHSIRSNGPMNPSSINQHFIKLGYKGLMTAHGVRSIPLTVGQEVLGFSHEVIQRQMDHVIGDKVRQAYDRSQFLQERRTFMEAWCSALVDQGLVL
ncbi:tyrosine-type recombinase/integrase [Synechococcus sp. MIT S9504]|nr:Prophage CP4-57 integrase [Synechococcus sp. MIT S9504]